MLNSRVRTPFVLLILLAVQMRAEIKLKVHMDRVLQPDYLGVNARRGSARDERRRPRP
jgi:hypothetical protein